MHKKVGNCSILDVCDQNNLNISDIMVFMCFILLVYFISLILCREFDQNSEDFKLELIMRLNFQVYADDIAEISNAATMELNIENGLKAIREIWKNTTYEMQHHRDEMYRIKNVEEVMQVCNRHCCINVLIEYLLFRTKICIDNILKM